MKGEGRSKRQPRYPPLATPLPAHLHARLQAAATVLKVPVERVLEAALETHFRGLPELQRELIDRVAASLLQSSEPGPGERSGQR